MRNDFRFMNGTLQPRRHGLILPEKRPMSFQLVLRFAGIDVARACIATPRQRRQPHHRLR